MFEHFKWTTFGGQTLEHGYTISLPCEPDGSGNDMLHGQKNTPNNGAKSQPSLYWMDISFDDRPCIF